jgi:hypothetical protein
MSGNREEETMPTIKAAAVVAIVGLAAVALPEQAAADRVAPRTTENVQATEFSSYRRYGYGRRYYRPYYHRAFYRPYYRPYWRSYYRPYPYYAGFYGYPYGYYWPRPFFGLGFGFGRRFWW